MKAPILRGNSSSQLQTQTYTFEPVKGGTVRVYYKGHDVDKAIAKYNLEYSRCSSARLDIKLGIAELELIYSGGTAGALPSNALALTQDRWELASESEPIDVWTGPVAYYALKAMALCANVQDNTAALEQKIANDAAYLRGAANKNPAPRAFGVTGKESEGVFYEDSATGQMTGWNALRVSYPGSADDLVTLYGEAASGNTHIEHYRTILRHTTSAPWYWSANIADFNTLLIYTTEQLLSEATNYNLWNYPIQPRLAYKINAQFNSTNGTKLPIARYGYKVGWLKGESTETGEGGNRIAIQTDYRWDQWSKTRYPGTVT